jgi:type III pantothenate kinase
VNIIIDQGNTSAKIAVFDGRKLLASFICKPLLLKRLETLLNEFSPSQGILSSVVGLREDVIGLLEQRLNRFIVLDEKVPIPIQNAYKTPETLGKDRIAAVVGGMKKAPRKNILVIDAGTAITYDFLDNSGVYRGGNISPGMTVRFKALHHYTKSLPMLDEHGDIPFIGYDTETAIRAGVIKGIAKEIDGYIDEFKQKYPDLLVFLTGGHTFYFETKLKNSIFADGNLVLEGLNEILIFQK